MKMTTSDLELLRQYNDQKSEAAFAELVDRHLPLVYSAAFRQLRSRELAQEVAQSVFADLARKASRFDSATIVPAWLYQVTRRTSIDCIRSESRRQLREQAAFELAEMNSDTTEWKAIEPLLDEGMESLEEQDRDAILLRYFDNKSLREVGALLGVSDDAAQKRVSRAVERLREYFFSRGRTITASTLVMLLATNAAQAVPAGIAIGVYTSVTAGATVAVAASVTKAAVMTTLQKGLLTALVVGLAGVGIYEARENFKMRDRVQVLGRQQAPLESRIQQLEKERDEANQQLLALQEAGERWKRDYRDLLKLRGEVGLLKKQLAEVPKTNSANAAVQEEVVDTSPVVTLKAHLRATVHWDNALVTGGWTTPGGKRAIVLAVPGRVPDDNAPTLKIETKIIELPEEKLNWFLEKQTADGVSTGVLGVEAYKAFMKMANTTAGVDVLSAPAISTLDGRACEISVTDTRNIGGKDFTTGPVINFIPKISADGQAVELEMSAVLTLLRQPTP